MLKAINCVAFATALCAALMSHCAAQDSTTTTDDQSLYQTYLQQAEASKSQRDFAGMEQNLKRALQYGGGDEYVWRSLSWAQSNQGKGSESLASARQNIRRNGECVWSLEQLAEAAVAYGDILTAQRAVRRALTFPRDQGASDALENMRAQLSTRTYSIVWTIDPAKRQKEADGKSIILALPATDLPYQSATWELAGVESYERITMEGNPAVRVKPKGDAAFELKAEIITKPYSYKRRLASPTPTTVTDELRAYLGKGKCELDPSKPLAQGVASQCRAGDAVSTVRRICEWFKANAKWDVSTGGDPTEDIIKRKAGNCSDLARAFVAVCRAAGIPSRPVRGQVTLGNKGSSGPLHGHSWVEVYVGGVGWAPLEPGDPASFGKTDTMKFRYFHYGFEAEWPLFNLGNLGPEESHFRLTKSSP